MEFTSKKAEKEKQLRIANDAEKHKTGQIQTSEDEAFKKKDNISSGQHHKHPPEFKDDETVTWNSDGYTEAPETEEEIPTDDKHKEPESPDVEDIDYDSIFMM